MKTILILAMVCIIAYVFFFAFLILVNAIDKAQDAYISKKFLNKEDWTKLLIKVLKVIGLSAIGTLILILSFKLIY